MSVDQVINLSAAGGDATAAEIAKTGKALDGVTQVSKGMEEQFSHRFTHIGLQLFAGDLIRTSGLAGETKQIIGVMQTSVMAASSAFGAASGPILLVVSGLTALVGIASKVIDKHSEEAAALEKLVEQQTKSKEGYDAELLSLTRYQQAGGQMTAALTALLNADKAVSDDMKSNLLATQEKEIAALEKQRAELGKQQEVHNLWVKAMSLAKEEMIAVAKIMADMIVPGLSFFSGEVMKLVSGLGSLAGSIGQHVKLTGQFKEKYDQLTASIAKMKVQHQNTAKSVTTDLSQMAKAAEDSAQLTVDAQNAASERSAQIWETEQNRERQQMDNRLNYFIQNKQNEIAEQQKASEKQEKIVAKYTDLIAKDFGSAMAKSIVEGKNFSEQMQQAVSNMAEQFIERVIEMVIQWALLKAVMEIWPGGEAAFQSSSNASYPALSNASYSGLGADFGGAMATGGSRVVNKPTMFLAGEAGPEVATFTPLGSSGGGGQGGGVGQVVINLNVDKIDGNDPASTLDMLSNELRRESSSARQFAATVSGVASRYPNQAY